MQRKIEVPDADWRSDFDSVRLDQMLRFRALTLREKIQAMEDMAEIVEAARKARARAARKPSGTGR